MTWQDRFGPLLKQMSEGEPHESFKMAGRL